MRTVEIPFEASRLPALEKATLPWTQEGLGPELRLDPSPFSRLIVIDNGQRFAHGHHFPYNFGLLVECLKIGLPTEFYVYHDCDPTVVDALHARPVLTTSPYVPYSNDEQCGFLEDFLIAGEIGAYTLRKELPPDAVEPTDVVLVHTAQPKTVMGVTGWYMGLPEERRPHLVLIFQNHGPVHVQESFKALVRSVFRLALKPLASTGKVHLGASNSVIAPQIRHVAGLPCPVYPVPLQRGAADRSARLADPGRVRHIGFVGEGRFEQGVEKLPDIIDAVLANHRDVRFTIQLGCYFATRAFRRRLAVHGQNVTLIERCVTGDAFHDLLSTFDALLLPYDPTKYIDRSSQIVVEGIVAGLALIVPGKTSLEREAALSGCGVSLIAGNSAMAGAQAVEAYLADRENLERRSDQAARVFARFHSAHTLLGMLLAACRSGQEQPEAKDHPVPLDCPAA